MTDEKQRALELAREVTARIGDYRAHGRVPTPDAERAPLLASALLAMHAELDKANADVNRLGAIVIGDALDPRGEPWRAKMQRENDNLRAELERCRAVCEAVRVYMAADNKANADGVIPSAIAFLELRDAIDALDRGGRGRDE